MRRKYHKTGTVILCILAAAVICVFAIIFFIHKSGIRYWRTDTGVKYFGRVDSDEYITYGRMWFESAVASISVQRHYIVEIEGENLQRLLSAPYLRTLLPADDVLQIVNESIPEYIREGFPLGHFVFNQEGASVLLHRESFSDLIRRYERARNNIISGEILTGGGALWRLRSASANPSSFRDFEIVPDTDHTRPYRGNLIRFLENEQVSFASFTLANGNVINLYPAHGIYRIVYERGPNSGDIFIGAINDNLQKNGRGLFFHSMGDIYFGDFVRDDKTGTAKILFTHGGSYSGDILNGRKEGEGTFRWSDGSEYTGGFVDNMKNGHGKYLFPDGSVYEGDWVNGVRHGQGKFVFPSGDFYIGSFENDLFSGHGRYTWASGEFYEGNFVNNAIHGWGRFHWVGTGRTYEGWFSNGEMVLDPPPGFE